MKAHYKNGFIYCEALFMPGDTEQVAWEAIPFNERDDHCVLRGYRFRPDEVQSYNITGSGWSTTIRFKNGYDISIKATLEEIDELMDQAVYTAFIRQ